MAIELDVLFKKIQKDDKKEILEFHILGDEVPYKNELMGMAGGMAVLTIGEIKLSIEFKSIQRDSKKVALKFEAKGDSEDQVIQLYPKAGFNLKLSLQPSQMTIDDLGEHHEGVQYGVNADGTVEVKADQMSLDDIPDEAQDPFDDEIANEDDLLN